MRKVHLLLIVAFLACVFACGKEKRPEPPPEKIDVEGGLRKTFPIVDRTIGREQLRAIGIAYKLAAAAGVVPKTIEELEGYYENRKITKAIKDETYVVLLGVDPDRQPGNAVLAYQKEPDANGQRVVLTCNGQVQVMDATTFEAAPKAKGK